MKIINKVILKVLKKIKGKIKNQKFFEEIYITSLHGMNIGLGGNTSASGEKNAFEQIAKKLSNEKNIVIFDVGANIGDYSRMVYEVIGKKAKIYAFEPSRITYNKMIENTKDIGNISRYNFGFGDVPTETKLYTNADGSGLASIYKRNLQHFNIDMNQEETIEISTIDKFYSDISGGGGYHIYIY